MIASLTSERPPDPDDADFGLLIDFQKGSPRPERIFQAAEAMVRTFQRLDHILCDSISTTVEPVMLLEDLEAGSLRAWFRTVLVAIDDDAIKKLDWRPLIGKYLVRAKYAVIRWSNKPQGHGTLTSLAQEIRTIAAETDVKRFPDYAPPSVQSLAEAVTDIGKAKGLLAEGDKMTYIPPDMPPVEFDLSVSWTSDDLLQFTVKERIEFPAMPMNLIVKRPDYLGVSKWEFRHGKKSISAKIEHREWLRAFQNRKVDVRPGDALRCIVKVEHSYGYDNELVSEDFAISQVIEVLENHNLPSPDLFEPPS